MRLVTRLKDEEASQLRILLELRDREIEKLSGEVRSLTVTDKTNAIRIATLEANASLFTTSSVILGIAGLAYNDAKWIGGALAVLAVALTIFAWHKTRQSS
ncbi:hypothetical protein K2Z84_12190 [Candidatus Binatia bacterium]|nr:hypothetical protein [Candidatus Binatia bacterium]